MVYMEDSYGLGFFFLPSNQGFLLCKRQSGSKEWRVYFGSSIPYGHGMVHGL